LMVSFFFLHLFYMFSAKSQLLFYNEIITVPSQDWPKLIPQTEVWPPALIVDMPTTIGSGYVLMVSFFLLSPFLPVFSYVSVIFYK